MEMLNYNNLSKSELFEMFKIKKYKNKYKLKFISKHQKDIFSFVNGYLLKMIFMTYKLIFTKKIKVLRIMKMKYY